MNALHAMSKDESESSIALELREMGDAMRLWTQGPRGAFFNSFGTAFDDDDDVTHIDLGTLTTDGNEDMLQVAMLAIIYNVNALGERHKSSGRNIEVRIDEGHYIAQNDHAAKSVTVGTKVWRKLSIWLTIATQDFADFTAAAKKILAQAEFWILLSMTPSEAKVVAQFKDLTDEQTHMIKQAKKSPGKYVEGVLLSEAMKPALLRFGQRRPLICRASRRPAPKQAVNHGCQC